MNDIDILVDLRHRAAAARGLIHFGYLPETMTAPRWNYEWVFRCPGLPMVELHTDLLCHWKMPWNGARLMLATSDPDALVRLHALHSLAHFAHHKGFVRPIQEIDLVTFTTGGWLDDIPQPLRPAASLWRRRLDRFWSIKADLPTDRRILLDRLYGGRSARWRQGRGPAALQERMLGILLSTRWKGVFDQLFDRSWPVGPSDPDRGGQEQVGNRVQDDRRPD